MAIFGIVLFIINFCLILFNYFSFYLNNFLDTLRKLLIIFWKPLFIILLRVIFDIIIINVIFVDNVVWSNIIKRKALVYI